MARTRAKARDALIVVVGRLAGGNNGPIAKHGRVYNRQLGKVRLCCHWLWLCSVGFAKAGSDLADRCRKALCMSVHVQRLQIGDLAATSGLIGTQMVSLPFGSA